MAIEMAGLSEALALGASMGLDPAKLTAVMNTSSARCWASECYNPVPVSLLQETRGLTGKDGAVVCLPPDES
jgi:3-hydroxyisobutyrate dehydrogenase